MPYPPQFQASLTRVAASRPARLKQTLPELTPAEKRELLEAYHPDFRPDASAPMPYGPNQGEPGALELVKLLNAPSVIEQPERVRLDAPNEDVDVLVIGGGGAGLTAALVAANAGVSVLLTTKLRLGDSNTIMATGMAVSTQPDDSPVIHYLDTMGGGGFHNDPDLVEAMVLDGPVIASWFEDLGVMFDRSPEGKFSPAAAGGYSRRRSISCKDYTGLELTRVLRDELRTRHVPTLEFHPAVELLLDGRGHCAGAVLRNIDTGHLRVVRARATILTTGGMGRLHPHGFPTTNHYGATADGIVMGYRAGARLAFMDSVQYHPTGVVWPEQMFGWLVSERCRALNGHLVDVSGERFIYERQTRDAVASAIMRQCDRGFGVKTPADALGVWMDTPVISILGGAEARYKLSAMYARFMRYDIDIWQEPVLVYPTQHYQNGGIKIDADGQTSVPGLYAAGEVSGGVHGRNRLGGNSLIEVFVFGRRAALHAAQVIRDLEPGTPSLRHVAEHNRRAGKGTGLRSPLLLPRYANGDTRLASDMVSATDLEAPVLESGNGVSGNGRPSGLEPVV